MGSLEFSDGFDYDDDYDIPEEILFFLDIDGVLIEKNIDKTDKWKYIEKKAIELSNKKIPDILSIRKAQSEYLNKKAIDNLNSLIKNLKKEGYNIKIVIMSSWRIGINYEDLKNQVFNSYYFSKYIIDKTNDHDQTQKENRGLSIYNWLNRNKIKDIKYFIIDDDNKESILKLFTKDCFIKVNPDKLFSKNDMNRIYNSLK